MFSLLKKEINSFFNSITGYLAISVFLLTISIFIWLPSSSMYIVSGGYSNLHTLFTLAPWVFMFLIPAITMRSFADEKNTGTIEILITKPLTDFQIIISKYIAGVLIVIFSLIPTLLYFFSVYFLGKPIGNIDTGGTWGSYIGLLFLGASFVAIGVFASSITKNQIIAFIIGMFLCFFVYIGFEQISSTIGSGKTSVFINSLGINYHYNSISRGVIDTRDIIYYLSLISFFILLTKTILESRKW